MSERIRKELIEMAEQSKEAFSFLAVSTSKQKNDALRSIAEHLRKNSKNIIEANKLDVANMRNTGAKESLVERLFLDESRLEDICDSIFQIMELDDPVYEVSEVGKRPNGLQIAKMFVPIGVVAMIYESRPNVTVDAAVITLKTSNTVILRGGKEAIHTNLQLVNAMREGLKGAGFPENCISFINHTEREYSTELMKLRGYVDLLIPRGGSGLIRSVVENATVPVIETGTGNCHLFVDESADLNMAVEIAYNAKIQRPGACNAIETILVHENIAKQFLPMLHKKFKEIVEIRGSEEVCKILPEVLEATGEDFETEFLDYVVAVKIVKNISQAMEHINSYGTRHSEIIVTNNYQNAVEFQRKVDAAAVYINASSRFSDGGEFGFGAEIGISTQKFHARGPMGLKEIMTYKYVILGEGQIR